MKRGVRNLKARKDVETTFLCLSNSNQVYIDTILKVRQFRSVLNNFINFALRTAPRLDRYFQRNCYESGKFHIGRVA